MSVEQYIARRYLFGKKKFSFINIISFLATLGILFGVAALIVVMSVFNGFSGLVTSILQDFDPHVKVERIPRTPGISRDSVQKILSQRNDIAGMSPFVERKAMAMADANNNFVWVKGVDQEKIHSVSGVAEKILLGSFSFETPNGIILGINLSDKMRVLVGDTITLISPAGMENILTQYVAPTVLRCPVVGIYESKNKLYDGSYAFVSLATAQQLFRMGNGVTGYELRLHDVGEAAMVKKEIAGQVGNGWNVLTWYDLHKDLYSMMQIERWSAFILLSLIITVAVFNILASLTMLVVEKKRDIGILRTLGLANKNVQKVFLLEGLWIGLIGVLSGLAVGLTLTILQKEYGFFTLDAAFIIPALPVEILFSDIIVIVLSTFCLCLLAAWYPSVRAKEVTIIDAVRWE